MGVNAEKNVQAGLITLFCRKNHWERHIVTMWIPILHNFECHKGKIAMLKISTQESEAFTYYYATLLQGIGSLTATHYYICHFPASLMLIVHFIQVGRKEEGKTKWLIWLLLDAQIFVQKDLCIQNTANTFFFPTVLQPSFIPISSLAWKFSRSPFREELFLIRTGCSEIAEQKPTIFRFSRGWFRSC